MAAKKKEAYRKGELDAIQDKPERPRSRQSQGPFETQREYDERIEDHYEYKKGYAIGRARKPSTDKN